MDGITNLGKLLEAGAKDPSKAHDIFSAFLNYLATEKTERPPVLFAADQLNSLYSVTGYHDQKSNVLTSDRLTLTRSLVDFYAKPLLNGSSINALDSQYAKNSPLFSHTAQIAPDVLTGEIKSSSDLYKNVFSQENVRLPESLDKTVGDPFHDKKSMFPNLKRLEVSPLSRDAISEMLKHYQKKSVLFGMIVMFREMTECVDDVTDTYVQMMSTMSGGNPEILLRDATTYVWTENAKRLSEQEKEEEQQ